MNVVSCDCALLFVGVDLVAKRVIKSCQTSLKDVIISAGLTNIIYHCEEKDLITESVKSTLVSTTTGHTEEHRAYQLVDAIRNGMTLSTALTVMDELLCILHRHAARTGQALSRRIAEQCEIYCTGMLFSIVILSVHRVLRICSSNCKDSCNTDIGAIVV